MTIGLFGIPCNPFHRSVAYACRFMAHDGAVTVIIEDGDLQPIYYGIGYEPAVGCIVLLSYLITTNISIKAHALTASAFKWLQMVYPAYAFMSAVS